MWALWVLFILAAALPIIGFGRLLWRTQATLNLVNRREAERGFAGPNRNEMVSEHPSQPSKVREVRNDVLWDIVLVGVGLSFGALASIIALYA
jgi:hypothetical protein